MGAPSRTNTLSKSQVCSFHRASNSQTHLKVLVTFLCVSHFNKYESRRTADQCNNFYLIGYWLNHLEKHSVHNGWLKRNGERKKKRVERHMISWMDSRLSVLQQELRHVPSPHRLLDWTWFFSIRQAFNHQISLPDEFFLVSASSSSPTFILLLFILKNMLYETYRVSW